MPTLDTCIDGYFTSGNQGGTSGATPPVISVGTLENPNDYNPEAQTYSWDFSKFYNAFQIGAF